MQVNLDEKMKRFYSKESQVYNKIRFDSGSGAFYKEFENEIISSLANAQGKSVLDVATGTGRIAINLAKGGANVTGVDLTTEMLDKAIDEAKKSNLSIQFVNGTARNLRFKDNSFDVVTSIRFLHLLPKKEEEKCLNEMYRVLKKNGTLIIEYNNFFYGAFLIPIIEMYRKFIGLEGEKFIMPYQIRKRLRKFKVKDVYGLGFPFLGKIAKINKSSGKKISYFLSRSFFKYFSAQLLIRCYKL